MHVQLAACQFITLPRWHGAVKPIFWGPVPAAAPTHRCVPDCSFGFNSAQVESESGCGSPYFAVVPLLHVVKVCLNFQAFRFPGTEAVVSFEPSSTLKPPAAAVSGGRASESRPEPWWAITMCACFAALPLTCCSAKPPSTDHRGQAHTGRLPWGMSARSSAPTECDCPGPGSKTPWNGRVCVTMAGLFAKDMPSACKGTQCWAAASDA